jgi:hypothetical protein
MRRNKKNVIGLMLSLTRVLLVPSNIVISRILSAYFLRFPLISAANAEEESAFFGDSFSENKYVAKGRKEISRASTAASEVA